MRKISHEKSSGNVFKDLGFKHPKRELRRAKRILRDPDDAPLITKAMLDRAEVRDGNKVIRRGKQESRKAKLRLTKATTKLTDEDMRAFKAEAAELIAHMTRFVKKNYGRRCREHQDGCPVCEMWRRIDWFKERTA